MTGEFKFWRKIAGADAGLVRQNEIQRPAQSRLLRRRCLAIPGLERRGGVDIERQFAGEKFPQFIFVLDQSGATLLGFEFVRLLEHTRIRAHAVDVAIDIATHQRLAHEYRMRQHRILRAELHRALFHQSQSEQRHLLERQHRAALARPVRIAPTAFD